MTCEDTGQCGWLALDQGGHGSRALVLSARGRVLARAFRAVPVARPRPGWVEQDAEATVASLSDAAEEAVAAAGGTRMLLAGAGLATQRASAVCWDRASGSALTPVLSWQDTRAEALLAPLRPDAAAVTARTGLPLSAHYGASKLRWCVEHVPAVGEALRAGRLAFGPLASFLAFRLCRERPLCVDPASASRTGLWNLARGDWDGWLLGRFGLPAAPLPRCVPTRWRFGHLAVAGQTPALRAVSGDQSAALFAGGWPDPGAAYVNLGTGAFVQRVLGDGTLRIPGLLASPVLRDRALALALYAAEGTVNGAGRALEWAAARLGLGTEPAVLADALACAGPPPLFLNGVAGLGAPYWVADFPSRFVGDGDARLRLAAVAESIVFLLGVILRAMDGPLGPASRLVASGGLAASDGLCRRLADLCSAPVERLAEREATARGIAFLAAGCPDGWDASRVERRFEPGCDPELRARFERWCGEMQRAVHATP